jgi:hypothetical protein
MVFIFPDYQSQFCGFPVVSIDYYFQTFGLPLSRHARRVFKDITLRSGVASGAADRGEISWRKKAS